MKPIAFAVLVLVCFAAPIALRAQVVAPTPSPDPHTYSDPAMNFVAPPQAVLIRRITVPVSQLGDNLEPVAVWALDPGKANARIIEISMEAFTGPPNQWEGQFESQIHNQSDNALVRDRTPMSLTNGMPATLVDISIGSGFQSQKEYAVVWADNQRGIALAEIGRLGDFDKKEALRVLHDVNAVAYPVGEP
jgi:hypothetical protein